MVNFFVGFFSFAAIFAACYILCFGLRHLKENMFKAKTKPADIPAEQSPEQENTRVYYITPPPKKRKKRPKTQSIGLKGAMMPKGTVVITDPKALPKKTRPSAKQTQTVTQKSTDKKQSAKAHTASSRANRSSVNGKAKG